MIRALILFFAFGANVAFAEIKRDLSYFDASNQYTQDCQRCILDLYLPEGESFATLLWFHGGGLKNGDKSKKITVDFAKTLQTQGIAVVAVNYRLYPHIKYPAFLYDSAAAFAWVKKNIVKFGGDPEKVYLGGHSAGGYLALMFGLDRQFLNSVNLAESDVAGLIPVSGQTVTHSSVRQEAGFKPWQIIADEASPLFHVRKFEIPMLLVAAENDTANRLAENRLLFEALRNRKTERTEFLVIGDRGHNSIMAKAAHEKDPLVDAIKQFIGKN